MPCPQQLAPKYKKQLPKNNDNTAIYGKNSDLYAAEVREDEATYQKAGVTGVPAYIINGRYLISGAQEPDTLVQAFEEIGAESA